MLQNTSSRMFWYVSGQDSSFYFELISFFIKNNNIYQQASLAWLTAVN